MFAQKLLRFLLSWPNILGLMLMFVLNVGWIVWGTSITAMVPFVLGLLGYGLLQWLWPRKEEKVEIFEQFAPMPAATRQEELNLIREYLARLLETNLKVLPKSMGVSLRSVADRMNEVLGSAMMADPAMVDHFMSLKAIATRYLPQAIGYYVRIPVAMRAMRFTGRGKTAGEILVEQLQVLDKELGDMLHAIAEESLRDLVIHGNFLRAKFGTESFELADKKTKDEAIQEGLSKVIEDANRELEKVKKRSGASG